MNISNIDIKDALSIISNFIAILTFLFFVVRALTNYKYGLKCEEKFKIPCCMFEFNIEKVLIETFEYVLMLITIIGFAFLSKVDISWYIFPNFSKGILLYISIFFYIIGTLGVVKEKYINRQNYEKTNMCCEIIKVFATYVIIPVIVVVLCIHIHYLFNLIIFIMIIGAIFSTGLIVYNYFNVDNKEYEIILDENNNYYAILSYVGRKYVVIDVLEDSDKSYFKIKEMGNYRIVDKVSINNRKYARIKV